MSALADAPLSPRLQESARNLADALTEREHKLKAALLAEMDARIDARVAEILSGVSNRSVYDA